ncbi:hypothetical protein [Streptomyces sp. NPDC001781]
MSPAPYSPDARAVVRAIDALTTQVKRVADTMATPVAVIRDGVTTPLDAQPQTTDDGTRCPSCDHKRESHDGNGKCWFTGCMTAPCAQHPAPAADEEAQRSVRRDNLLLLLTRLQGGLLSAEEKEALRQCVRAEITEGDTAREVAAGNKRHVQVMYCELTEAQAAIERVRALRQPFVMWRDIAAALNGTEQAAEEQPTCTATIPDTSTPDTLHHCVMPAGHYDETDVPVHPWPNRRPGGWHTDGEGHAWLDRAANATPHTEPTAEDGTE